jgi:hypothetical protein
MNIKFYKWIFNKNKLQTYNWKYIRYKNKELNYLDAVEELYNIVDDPNETAEFQLSLKTANCLNSFRLNGCTC